MARAASKVTPTPPPAVSPRSNVFWLLPTGLFALAAIGILWALPRPATPCLLIYPPAAGVRYRRHLGGHPVPGLDRSRVCRARRVCLARHPIAHSRARHPDRRPGAAVPDRPRDSSERRKPQPVLLLSTARSAGSMTDAAPSADFNQRGEAASVGTAGEISPRRARRRDPRSRQPTPRCLQLRRRRRPGRGSACPCRPSW